MSTDNVRIISDASLREAGFIEAQIQAAAAREDAYVGELDGVKYYRAQQDVKIMGEFVAQRGVGRSVSISEQQGDYGSRPDRRTTGKPSIPNE